MTGGRRSLARPWACALALVGATLGIAVAAAPPARTGSVQRAGPVHAEGALQGAVAKPGGLPDDPSVAGGPQQGVLAQDEVAAGPAADIKLSPSNDPRLLGAADPVSRWHRYVAEAARRFAVPAAWIEAVMCAESGGRPAFAGRPVTSRAGAMGLMQLMPATWAEMRDALGLGADPYDPRDNILAGTAYLARLYRRFGYPGLFGAYNAGPARYAAWLSGHGSLPAETRLYLARVGARGDAAGLFARAGDRPAADAVAAPTGARAVPSETPAGSPETAEAPIRSPRSRLFAFDRGAEMAASTAFAPSASGLLVALSRRASPSPGD